MLRKSISAIVLLILVSLIFGSLSAANAQESKPACLPYEPSLMEDKGFMQSLPPECSKASRELLNKGGDQVIGTDVTSLTVGGPDVFGYTWDDSVPFNWIDATDGTDTGLSGAGWDNATGLITLPFPFKYYEDTYTQVYIAASGHLAFTDYGYWPEQQSPFPSIDQPNNVIAPFWTVINLANSGPASRVYYKSGGITPNR